MNPLDCKDINEFRIFKTSRITNPLTPIYDVQDENNHQIQIGHVDGSKSRIRHPDSVNKEVSFSLKCEDIDGCKTSTVGNPYIRTRFHHTQTATNVTKDIPGAQISTLKKGIQTKRHLNPLVPQYKYLDYEAPATSKAVHDNELQAAEPRKKTPPETTNERKVSGNKNGVLEEMPMNQKEELMFDSQKVSDVKDLNTGHNEPKLLNTEQFLNNDFGETQKTGIVLMSNIIRETAYWRQDKEEHKDNYWQECREGSIPQAY